MDINIGIEADDRKKIAEKLSKLLADSYTLYVLTHNYHWNVTGPMFKALHEMFEEQYTELATAVDEIAERIRALGAFAPGTFAEFMRLSDVEQGNGKPPEALVMIKNLVKAHETVTRTAREIIPVADEAGDDSSVDLATQRMAVHEKTAWMLRSLLEN
ncbi:MAG: DNA starvation/stationary phase protection protein [Ectothiorhodospiraceae bacterium]|nr:DNA starvation/stationary phase protection protein [Ectothiorhodospiraceae bacterium]